MKRPFITAKRLRVFHLAATVFWVIMIYPTIVYWKDSVPYLVFISVYAIIVSHFEAWQTSRLERKQEKQEQS